MSHPRLAAADVTSGYCFPGCTPTLSESSPKSNGSDCVRGRWRVDMEVRQAHREGSLTCEQTASIYGITREYARRILAGSVRVDC